MVWSHYHHTLDVAAAATGGNKIVGVDVVFDLLFGHVFFVQQLPLTTTTAAASGSLLTAINISVHTKLAELQHHLQ